MLDKREERLFLVNHKIDELLKRVDEEKCKSEKVYIKRLESLKAIDSLLNDLKEIVKHF